MCMGTSCVSNTALGASQAVWSHSAFANKAMDICHLNRQNLSSHTRELLVFWWLWWCPITDVWRWRKTQGSRAQHGLKWCYPANLSQKSKESLSYWRSFSEFFVWDSVLGFYHFLSVVHFISDPQLNQSKPPFWNNLFDRALTPQNLVHLHSSSYPKMLVFHSTTHVLSLQATHGSCPHEPLLQTELWGLYEGLGRVSGGSPGKGSGRFWRVRDKVILPLRFGTRPPKKTNVLKMNCEELKICSLCSFDKILWNTVCRF